MLLPFLSFGLPCLAVGQGGGRGRRKPRVVRAEKRDWE